MKIKLYRYRFFIVTIFFFLGLFLFYGFSRLVRLGVFNSLDLAFTVKLQDAIDNTTHLRIATVVGVILEGSVALASPAVSVVLTSILSAWAILRKSKPYFRWKGLLIPLGFLAVTLIEIYGKTKVEHASPPYFLLKNPITHFPAHYVIEEYSYPSGHAARALYLTVAAVFAVIRLSGQSVKKLFRKLWFLSFCLLSFVFCLLVSLSVIYLGHHWLTDIAGGWILALAFGLVIGFFYLL